MFGMRVEGPANIYLDNELLAKSVTMPEFTSKTKHLSTFYHAVREAVAGGKGWNLSDYLTKVLDGPKIREVVRKILH